MANIYEKLLEVKKAWITLQRDTKAFNYKYATLDQIQSKLWDVLQAQKLVIVHFIRENKVITQIRDVESESFIESEIEMITSKPQDKWSEITYYRRYNLLSLLDLEVEDDDWKKAQNSEIEEKEDIPKNKPVDNTDNLPWIWDQNIDKLSDLIAEWKTFTMADIRKKYKISKVNALKLNNIWIT